MAETVIILGATGLFGGHLARELIACGRYDVVCAGRDANRLADFTARHGGRWHVVDRASPDAVAAMLAALRPFAVVDVAGPFQDYGAEPYRFAAAVIAAGGHYLDIADAPEFVAGITALDTAARDQGVVALSGASSTPAISSAVVDALRRGLTTIDLIEAAIVPGNRTPRGLSVMRAILRQVGQPISLWRDGAWTEVRGWGETRRIDLAVPGMQPVKGRLASLVDTPDLKLFPDRYGARAVEFRAGLELSILHRALAIGRLLVTWRLVGRLDRWARPALHVAAWLQGLGSNLGGMTVRVVGTTAEGARELRTWDLMAPDGQGPRIPTQPVVLLLEKIKVGKVAPGARPCLGELDLAVIEAKLAGLGVRTARRTEPLPPLFQTILGDAFATLPAPIRAFHSHLGRAHYAGRADIDGPEGVVARLAARCAGFPPPAKAVPVRVTIDVTPEREVWCRTFGDRSFRSVLTRSPAGGNAVERFGPLAFDLDLQARGGSVYFPVRRARLLGFIPIPRALVPESIAREYVDAGGRYCFDVLVRLRHGRRIAHYRGHLHPVAPAAALSNPLPGGSGGKSSAR